MKTFAKIPALAKLHQNQNDATREAHVFRARQIQRERRCTWGEALRLALNAKPF